MYVRFPLSLRHVEDLLHERGIDICHETVRFWWNRFGPMFAAEVRKKRSAALRALPQWRWHLDEAVASGRAVSALQGKAEHLPLRDCAVDFLCMDFALRHAAGLNATFREYRRVLCPGGRLLLMEMTPPSRGLLRFGLRTYMRYVVPFATWLLTGSRSAKALYEYCWDTFDRCVPPERVVVSLAEAGLERASCRRSARIFSEYTAQRPH